MKVDVILGLQWGDEGKGKIVDVLTPNYQIVARFQGGPNAGHTLEFENQKYILKSIPSGIFQKEKINIIGNGMVVDPAMFKQEIETLEASGHKLTDRLYISKKAHLILPTHRLLDIASKKKRRFHDRNYRQRNRTGLHRQNSPQRTTDRRYILQF